MTRPVRALAITLVVGAALSACGLKPEVKDQLSSGTLPGGGSTGGVLGGDTTGTGGTSGTGGSTGSTGTSGTSGTGGFSTSGSSGTGGSTGTSGTSGSTGTSGTSGSTGQAPVKGQGTTTGIDFEKKTIRIALHGPLTGAGVPQESFRTGTPKYWAKYKLANGFSVIAQAIDDKYNAADASRACNAAADTDFLIVGGAGTDQISACAQSPKLQRLKVPYLSSGVTAVGLGSIPTYHATSLTYAEQAPLLVQLAKKVPGRNTDEFTGKKWAVVITSTPNFKDAREAFVAELQKNGAQGAAGAFNPERDVFLTDKAPSNCGSLATSIRAGGYQSIYFLGQPSFFAQCVGQIGTTPINPYYTGPGPSFGISSVISLACKASAGLYKGVYLHPSPSVAEYASKLAPGQSFTDDIEFGIWGGMEQLKRVFDSVQGPLSRESFNAAIEGHRFSGFPNGVLHPTDFTSDRFGGTAAFANEAGNCASASPVSKTIGVYNK